MTQEEKELLIKDICARLPYNIKFGFENSNVILIPKDYCYFTQQLFSTLVFPEHNGMVEYGYPIYEYRPYLRSMSSMTEEEKKSYNELSNDVKNYFGINAESQACSNLVNWLNKNYFDYRGLIPMGLALEASEGMYKIE